MRVRVSARENAAAVLHCLSVGCGVAGVGTTSTHQHVVAQGGLRLLAHVQEEQTRLLLVDPGEAVDELVARAACGERLGKCTRRHFVQARRSPRWQCGESSRKYGRYRH